MYRPGASFLLCSAQGEQIMSKTVMLDWGSRKFEVTDAGYDLIKQIIREHQMCPGCHNHIDDAEHLLVCKRCLACVLADNPSLTFIGFDRENEDGNRIYLFRNERGITLTSTQNHGDNPQEDVAYSIEQAGFVIPSKYKPFKSDEEIFLSRDSWRVYGKLDQSVVVLHYKENTNRGRLEVDFLAYKSSNTIPFNRRTTEHQNILDKARMLAERKKIHTSDASLFTIIAQLESVNYDAQLAFLEQEEPVQEEPEPNLFTQQEETAEQTTEPEEQEPVQLETRRRGRGAQSREAIHEESAE
jgi:hypothetical protein